MLRSVKLKPLAWRFVIPFRGRFVRPRIFLKVSPRVLFTRHFVFARCEFRVCFLSGVFFVETPPRVLFTREIPRVLFTATFPRVFSRASRSLEKNFHFFKEEKSPLFRSLANAHTAAKAPVLVRSPQLSAAGPRQYRVG